MIYKDSIVSRDAPPNTLWPDELPTVKETRSKCVISFVCLMLCGIIVVIVVILGRKPGEVPVDRSQPKGDTPAEDDLFESCNLDDLLFKCTAGTQSLSKSVPTCLAETFFKYQTSWVHDIDPDFDATNMDACETANKALMVVALYAQRRVVSEIDLKNIYGLASYFFLLNGENWPISFSWLSEKPVREWSGVEVNDLGEVVAINLRQLDIYGILPTLPALGTLKSLDLSLNMIQGNLPMNLGMLEVLHLENNMFNGTLPEIWTNSTHLRRIRVGFNLLTGTLPTSFGTMTKLEELSIPANEISGTIPSEIGGCYSLQELDVRHNVFEGLIPSEIGGIERLKYLDLGANSFAEGTFPEEILNLTNVVNLGLSACSLVGTLSSALGNLVNLSYVEFDMNKLHGWLPSELGLLSNVIHMDFSLNQLSGTLPSELGRLLNAEMLDFSGNLLNGTLPTDFGNLVKLDAFLFSGNGFVGYIPDEICGLWESGRMQVLGDVFDATSCDRDTFGGAICPYPECCPRCPGFVP
ncbi:hypothetical protein MHU86_95 [Fragilaria crotonensis]|nr:hypothetical protein MHU86_95 [Fragilaria crotonensis]